MYAYVMDEVIYNIVKRKYRVPRNNDYEKVSTF